MKAAYYVIGLLIVVVCFEGYAQHVDRLLPLSGTWKFEAGDDMRRAEQGFDDHDWETIRVPGYWEEQGYPGYDGCAWYRRHFRMPSVAADGILLLRLGTIDDADEVYVNGRFIGFTGQFPPNYITAYNTNREYQIPWWLIKPGEDNVVAVRVYDDGIGGGITGGDIGLYVDRSLPEPDTTFDGVWRFTVGDDPRWMTPQFDDRKWESVYVPAYWETEGHKGYDGIGWYRLRFTVPAALASQRLVLLLGRIDDCDEAYLNGKRIGRTGRMPEGTSIPRLSASEYRELRAYTIPAGTMKPGEPQVLAVRVYDERLHGGIYRGPLGLMTRDHYNRWRSKTHGATGVFQDLMEYFAH